MLWLGLCGLLLLTAACWPMQQQELPAWAVAALVAGLATWLLVAWRSAGRREGPEALFLDSSPPWRRVGGTLLSLALAAVSWREAAGGEFRAAGVAAWLAAIAIWLWAWWSGPPAFAARRSEPGSGHSLGIVLALLVILVIGGVFRFYRLAEIPPHPGSDHAEDLLNVVELERGERPIFFPRNTGQAPLPFYFEFWVHRVLGLPLRYLTLKVCTAAIGMLAIPAMYRLGAELGGAHLGLIAAALAAWSKWPTFGARRGLTYAWAVFPAALALAALVRYLRRGDRKSALSAGFWLGLGQFGYNAFKIAPLLVPLAFGFAFFDPRWKGRRGRLLADGLLVTATVLLVFLPLFQYMIQRPQDFWYRAMTRAGTLERPLAGPAPVVFASNLKNMALAFHWKGDNTFIDSVTGEPFLDPVTGALLLAGALVALLRAARGSRRWALVLASIPVLTLASTLALAFPIENPGTNRSAVAIPSVLLLAALPAAWMVEQARHRGLLPRLAATVPLLALACLSVQQNFKSYFVRYAWHQAMSLPPVLDLVRVMKEYAARGVPPDNVYLLNVPSWIDGRCIDLEIADPLWSGPHNVVPGKPVPFLLDRPLLFFVHPSDDERRRQLKEAFPLGEERLVTQPFCTRSYSTYFVPK